MPAKTAAPPKIHTTYYFVMKSGPPILSEKADVVVFDLYYHYERLKPHFTYLSKHVMGVPPPVYDNVARTILNKAGVKLAEIRKPTSYRVLVLGSDISPSFKHALLLLLNPSKVEGVI